MAGYKKTVEVLPAILVSGCSFAFIQWFSSNYLGPALPDVIAGIGSIVSLIVFLKFWKPKNNWRFANEPAPVIHTDTIYSTGQIIRAWSPFIFLTILIIAWGTKPIKEVFTAIGQSQFEFPGLHNVILDRRENLIPHPLQIQLPVGGWHGHLAISLDFYSANRVNVWPGGPHLCGNPQPAQIPHHHHCLRFGICLHRERFRHYHNDGRSLSQHGGFVPVFRAGAGLAGRIHYRLRHVGQCPVWQVTGGYGDFHWR